MASHKESPKLSLAAGALALRGARAFLAGGRAAAERRGQSSPERARVRRAPNRMAHQNKLPAKTLELLRKTTHFNKSELEALYVMYRKMMSNAQNAASSAPMGQPPPKVEGIDQSTFRDVMHNTFDLVTEEPVLERVWTSWESGPGGGEGALRFEPWVRGLSILVKGTDGERLKHCFSVYDLNGDGYITRDEMFLLLKNSLLKQPGDEDPDEGVRDLVEMVLRKLDLDKDGRVSLEDYKEAIAEEPLLLEAFGQCLPTRRQATTFLRTLNRR